MLLVGGVLVIDMHEYKKYLIHKNVGKTIVYDLSNIQNLFIFTLNLMIYYLDFHNFFN